MNRYLTQFCGPMKSRLFHCLPVLSLFVFLASCLKSEKPVVLPVSNARQSRVTLGDDYHEQVFFDLENGTIFDSSQVAIWDLAFEGRPEGSHIYMNGGSGIVVYNTHQTDMAAVTALPAITPSSWLMDDPSGDTLLTGVGEWRDASGNSKHEVYIVRAMMTATTYIYTKVQMQSVSSTEYRLLYGALPQTSGYPEQIIPKDPTRYFSYLKVSGGLVYPDPPNAGWDIVFKHYRHIYYSLNNLPYYVSGVLINPDGNVSAAADSTTGYDNITVQTASTLSFTHAWDVIGFDWKTYNVSASQYATNPVKCYLIRTRHGQLYKLHFLDFYSSTGAKGSPLFEYQRLQ